MPLKDKIKNKEYNRAYRAKHPERIRAWDAAWRKANPEKVRENNLKRMGFTAKSFEAALYRQGFCCAVCCTSLRDLPSKQVHADHDHVTGKARGVLCHHCNTGLGAFKDNLDTLRAAVKYLKRPTL